MNRIIFPVLLLVFYTSPIIAMEAPTASLGKKLYNASNIGSNEKSCASCHPDGKGLDEINAYDDGMLKEMVNFCIRDALKGEMIDLESTEIESFLIYLRSFKK